MKPTTTGIEGVQNSPQNGHQIAPSSDPAVCCASQDEAESDVYTGFVPNPRNHASHLRQGEEQFAKLMEITERINCGVTLEEILDFLYEEMQETIPYDRIGVSLIDRPREVVVARWARSNRPMRLGQGYEGQLKGSSLEQLIQTARPRIINDLERYAREKPKSKSTILIVHEGMRSSLTCPLIVQGKPVGFVFFSSVDKGAYSGAHVEFFQQIAGQLATIVEKGRLHDELVEHKAIIEKQNAAMTRELEMAQRVQQSLIPRQVPEIRGLEIAFEYEPAIQVGGDVLDIIPLADGRVLVFVADVMGHGVSAALVMAVVKAALHSAVQTDPRPANVLARVNEVIARLFTEHFVTAACCLVDSDGLSAELSLAGHAGPLRFPDETGTDDQDDNAGLPLGISEDSEYGMSSIKLNRNDALLFFTDGIVEAFNPQGKQYGMERLTKQLRDHGGSSPGSLCAGIRRDLKVHCGTRAQYDDLTLLVVKFA